MIPPKLNDIFTNIPELFENKKLEDWWSMFGPIDFDSLLQESTFNMDISKVIRKNEFKGFHQGYYFGQLNLKTGKYTGIGRLVILDEFFYCI